MIPSVSIINTFAAQHPMGDLGMQQKTHPKLSESQIPRREPFPAWSVIDEAKKEAVREFESASKKAQEKAGKIEPWTPKYYAACIFGGLLACVSGSPYFIASNPY